MHQGHLKQLPKLGGERKTKNDPNLNFMALNFCQIFIHSCWLITFKWDLIGSHRRCSPAHPLGTKINFFFLQTVGHCDIRWPWNKDVQRAFHMHHSPHFASGPLSKRVFVCLGCPVGPRGMIKFVVRAVFDVFVRRMTSDQCRLQVQRNRIVSHATPATTSCWGHTPYWKPMTRLRLSLALLYFCMEGSEKVSRKLTDPCVISLGQQAVVVSWLHLWNFLSWVPLPRPPPLQLQSCPPASLQHWKLQPVNSGLYTLYTLHPPPQKKIKKQYTWTAAYHRSVVLEWAVLKRAG